MMSDLDSIGTKRKRLGITQKKLAMAAQISQSMITKIERGVVIPNYNIARRIFDFLGSEEHKEGKTAKDVMHRDVITVKLSDKISKIVPIAKKNAISQFPVVEGGRIVGGLATRDMIGAQEGVVVKDVMSDPFPTVSESKPVSMVKEMLKYDPVVIVLNKESIAGIITAEDLL